MFKTNPPEEMEEKELLNIKLSPSEAVAKLKEWKDIENPFQSITLRKLSDRILYEIILPNGDSYFIDACSGKLFSITREKAVKIARDHLGNDSPILNIKRYKHHSMNYSWGLLCL